MTLARGTYCFHHLVLHKFGLLGDDDDDRITECQLVGAVVCMARDALPSPSFDWRPQGKPAHDRGRPARPGRIVGDALQAYSRVKNLTLMKTLL